MGLQLMSADFLHENGITYLIRRDSLEQDFAIDEKQAEDWVECGLDQTVQDVNFTEFKRLGLLIKRSVDAD
ncbi:hypothetical protein [Synechococcus sp. M16CYN]|uniref:hypothetical protein n=1 Tax=Synechococcus sp. M16CYN TaxID=3103139 RepID=UPI0032441439